MQLQTKTACLFPNPRKKLPVSSVRQVADKLLSLGWSVRVTDPACQSDAVPFCTPGGRGQPIPLLGINFGTVGYMTELEIGELNLLDDLPDAPVEDRMLLDAFVTDANGTKTGPFLALNEAVVCRELPGKILKLTLNCDGHRVSSYRADGMILSTPTGSSAYNLSAGGPIIDPKLNAVVLCPLAAFTLSSVHPMVFSPESVLTIRAEGFAAITCDGKEIARLPEGGTLTVARSASALRMVKLKNVHFYEVLLRKLS